MQLYSGKGISISLTKKCKKKLLRSKKDNSTFLPSAEGINSLGYTVEMPKKQILYILLYILPKKYINN